MTIKNRFPNQRPDFSLDFNNTERIPPGVFSRASTGTFVGSNGLIQSAAVNQARFEHNPLTGESLGLLVEEARTNLITGSQTFNAGGWTVDGISITNNAAVAPDGTTTATSIVQGTGNNRTIHFDNNGAGNKTLTIFAKSNDGSSFIISGNLVFGTNNTGSVVLNTSNGTAGATIGVTSILLPNGWYKFSMRVFIGTGSGNTNFIGINGPASSVFIWGAQLEAGALPTSYIPTTDATVTRAADIVSINDTALPPVIASGGALFIETTNPLFSARAAILSLNDGSATNELVVRNLPFAGGTSIQSTISGITTSTDIIGGASPFENSFALRIKANDFALAGNSQPVVTASGAVPAFTQIKIGSSFTGGNGFAGTIKRLAFYSNELNNQELQGISAKPATVPPSAAEPVLYMLVAIESPNFAWNLRSTGTVNYSVDWGDGQIELAQTSNTKGHTYALPGIYKVVVRLNSGRWRPFYNNNVDVARIAAIAFTGTGWSFGTDLSLSFYGGRNILLIGNIDTSIVTNFSLAWLSCSSLTSFPLIDTSAGTNFFAAWLSCSSLTSFPLINTAAGTNFQQTWQLCSSLTSFPLINTAAGTNFQQAWEGCSSLTSFPAAMFDSCLATNFTLCWNSCALTAASIENIIVSINAAGTSSGTLSFAGGTNAIKSSWTAPANVAHDALVARGWTITFRT